MTLYQGVCKALTGGFLGLNPSQDSSKEFNPLWRMSGGNLEKARTIIKDVLPHYYAQTWTEKDFDYEFDMACADLYGGGCEIEWIS